MKRQKTDMDRIGLFSEMGYITVGDPFVDRKIGKSERTGKQLVVTSFKTKGADRSGYFAPRFLRLSEGDPYKTLDDIYRKKAKEAKAKNIAGPFINGALIKMDCGKGSYCATINPSPQAMSQVTRTMKKSPFKFAFITAPTKKGTGYGYADVAISPYIPAKRSGEIDSSTVRKEQFRAHLEKNLDGPFHITFPKERNYEPNPYKEVVVRKTLPKETEQKYAKHPKLFKFCALTTHNHGSQPGTVNKLPEFDVGVYRDPASIAATRRIDARNSSKRPYLPNSGTKTCPIFSTIQINLNKSFSMDNHRCFQSVINFKTC